MPRPALKNIDPKQIFLHANGIYMAEELLSNSVQLDRQPDLAPEIGQAVMVLSALNSELFFKCLICIETGLCPQGHYLADLFAQLSKQTRSRIESLWNTQIVPLREPMWQKIERSLGIEIKRDLSSALRAGTRAFEEIRYSYEPNLKQTYFYLSDLPRILGLVILEKKPEWTGLRRRVSELP